MASNRTYGLNIDAGETMRPQPFSLVGDGAGSDLQDLHHGRGAGDGHGHQRHTRGAGPIPGEGHGQRRRQGLPEGHLVRDQRRQLPRVDERHRRAGHLAQHRVRQADPASRGARARSTWRSSSGCGPTPNPAPPATTTPTATRAWPTSSSGRTSARSRSGPFEVNALELSNVAATLASGGTWCPPNPIDKLIDRNGNEVAVTTETCDQVVPEGLANTLANAMSKDALGGGTAAGSAGAAGWNLPVSGKTGTTEAHRSSGFVGFTNHYAAANYIYDDSTSPTDLCSSPLRHCGDGDLYGGNEPARTWFTAMKPIATIFGDVKLPPTDPRVRRRRHPVRGCPASPVWTSTPPASA